MSFTPSTVKKSKSASQRNQNSNSRRNNDDVQFDQDTSGVIQAKNDLMQLGIELDDELIQRLQKNLGIEKIFQVAHEAIHLIKNKPQVATGAVPEVSYRYVTNDTQSNKEKSTTAEEVSSSLFIADPRQSVQMLKQLENRENELEPQYRPIIDQMIEQFRLQYGRSPKRFISQLLGKNLLKEEKLHKSQIMPSAGGKDAQPASSALGRAVNLSASQSVTSPISSSAQEQQMIHKWILQKRYVDLEEFVAMIQRVGPQYSPDTVTAFYSLLAEDKKFASAKRRTVLDLFHFLNLLKSAVNESRRSFDAKTSRLAVDIEFWHRSNDGLQLGSEPSNNTTRPASSSSSSGNADRSQSTGRRCQRYQHYPDLQQAARLSVANLLGQADHEHSTKSAHGKGILGTIEHEFTNACNIPTALHSPLKIRSASPHLPRAVLQQESTLPFPPAPPKCYLDSSKVSYLMGNDTVQSTEPQGSSVNRLHREMTNKTSVAFALGDKTEPKNPATPRSFAIQASTWMDDSRSSNNHRSHSVTMPRYRMKSKELLYWNDTRPSVASALGHL